MEEGEEYFRPSADRFDALKGGGPRQLWKCSCKHPWGTYPDVAPPARATAVIVLADLRLDERPRNCLSVQALVGPRIGAGESDSRLQHPQLMRTPSGEH